MKFFASFISSSQFVEINFYEFLVCVYFTYDDLSHVLHTHWHDVMKIYLINL